MVMSCSLGVTSSFGYHVKMATTCIFIRFCFRPIIHQDSPVNNCEWKSWLAVVEAQYMPCPCLVSVLNNFVSVHGFCEAII